MGYYGELQSGELQNKNNITNTVNQLTTYVQETEDAFIFQTLSNFIAQNYQLTVEKEELVQVIQLIRMIKEHGESVHEHWYNAIRQSAMLEMEYNRGFRDGVEKERSRIADILNKGE